MTSIPEIACEPGVAAHYRPADLVREARRAVRGLGTYRGWTLRVDHQGCALMAWFEPREVSVDTGWPGLRDAESGLCALRVAI